MIDLNRLDQLTKLVHDDIVNDVTTELIDPEEQKVYNELYYIHTDFMKTIRGINDMPSNKQQIKAYIILNYGDSLNDIIQQTLKIPNEISRDAIYLEYDHDDRYVYLSYERKETDTEFEDRISLEKRREELDRNRDLNQLRYLLSVYGIPE